MGKLQKTALLQRSLPRGVQRLRARYDEKVRAFLKPKYPWARWDKDEKCWIVSDQVAKELETFLESDGWRVHADPRPEAVEPDPRLYEYQKADVVAAVRDGYRFLAYEMGLGKTPAAICTLKAANITRALVVCPASVREVWRDEVAKWWDGGPEVTCIESGKDAIPDEGIVAISYELLHMLVEYKGDWQAIIADESHNIKNYSAARSENLVHISDGCPSAIRLALTGTPIGNEPKDLHHQVSWLTPERWGDFWVFARRFCHIEKNEWGTKAYGAKNPAELREQFLQIGSRATWQQYKHLLPKSLPPQVHRVTNRDKGVLELCESVAGRAVVFTYLKQDAYTLSRALGGRPVFCVTGDMTPPERYSVLQTARGTAGALLVATMDSVGTGIDLTAFPIAIYAGLSYKIQTLLQSIGRVYRLTQKEPVRLHFVVQRGTQEEIIGMVVSRKLATNASVIDAGNADEKLAEMVGPEQLNSEQLLQEIREEITEVYGAGDEYL